MSYVTWISNGMAGKMSDYKQRAHVRIDKKIWEKKYHVRTCFQMSNSWHTLHWSNVLNSYLSGTIRILRNWELHHIAQLPSLAVTTSCALMVVQRSQVMVSQIRGLTHDTAGFAIFSETMWNLTIHDSLACLQCYSINPTCGWIENRRSHRNFILESQRFPLGWFHIVACV